MNNIFAGFAPDTQRKDKFGLNMQVTRGELNKLNQRPFFALYMQRYGSKVLLPNFIASKIFALFCPEEFRSLAYAKSQKQRRIFGKKEQQVGTIMRLAAGVSLRKGSEEEGFTLRLPVFSVTLAVSELDSILKSVYTLPYEKLSATDTPEQRQEKTDKNDVVDSYCKRLYDNMQAIIGSQDVLSIRPETLINLAKNAQEKTALSAITRCYLRKNGDDLIGFVEVKLAADDAKAFTGIDTYGAIRNIDIYPVFYSWVSNGFKDGPTTSVAISRISNALSPESKNYAKTNEFNLVISNRGDIYYIPKECDASREYEDAFIQCCKSDTSEDFCISNMATNGRKLPTNMPVLVDWTNNKYCYSNTSGNLAVIDLSQCRTLNTSHVINVLRRIPADDRDIDRFMEYMAVTKLSPNNYLTVKQEFKAGCEALNLREPTMYDICTEGMFMSYKQMLCDLGAALEKDPDPFYRKYSVTTGMTQIGLLSAINHYMSDEVMEKTLDEDSTRRSAAANQGVDEDWKLPSIPLLNPIIKAMPHQYRVLNKLKDNPNFALLPVAAGGGKTPLAIMEILYQYKQGKNAPYLVLCPSMLVSQYAQEVSFFTNARLNVIPITSKVIKREGFERLQKIFEAAPRNTVVVAAYSALAYQAHSIAYGVRSVQRYPTVEFLRQFGFQFALCDESHQLKNEGTTRSKSVRALLSDIPVIRLASGTMAYNMVSDMIGQTSIMDPSIFGSTKEFEARYGQWVKTSPNSKPKLAGLRPGAEAEIYRALTNNVVVAGAARKEWAALLPTPVTKYHFVELSEEQQDFYKNFVEEAVEEIEKSESYQKAMLKLAELKHQIEKGEADPEDLEAFEERLGAELRPYLQKIERFLLDPNSVSPIFPQDSSAKAAEVCSIIKEHEKAFKKDISQEGQENTNKTIVFTENTISAKAIFDAAERDPELKGTGLLYKASEKAVALNEFNKNPKIRWMVGVETSINTGLNLQAASRIIRAEYPWAPGAIEQGDARILRPNKKGKDTRKNVFFDWVICDGTIDTLKISRLMGKSVQVARFENPKDQRYQDIGQIMNEEGMYESIVPILSVSLANIQAQYRFLSPIDELGGGDLYPYYEAMQTLENLRRETFKEYREHHQDELNPDGTMKEFPFVVEENPKDAKLLRNTPYVEGTNLYKADELGLQRLDDYLMQYAEDEAAYQKALADEDAVDDSEATNEELLGGSPLETAILGLKDETCWTEYGECAIMSVSPTGNRVTVRPVNSNERIALTKDAVFVITRKETNPHELQNMILKSVGFKEYSDPEYVPPAALQSIKKKGRQVDPEVLKRREEERKAKELADLTIPLQVAVINGVLTLRYTVDKGHDLAVNVLQERGFTLANRYWYAKIKNKATLDNLLTLAGKLGYHTGEDKYDYASAWIEIGRMMRKLGTAARTEDPTFVGHDLIVTRIINEFGITNMLREEQRISTDKTLLRMRPMFVSGIVYAVMPMQDVYREGTRLRTASVRKIPGFIWNKSPKSGIFELYLENKEDAKIALQELKDNGLNISNFEDINKQLDNIVMRAFKSSKQLKNTPAPDTKGGKKKTLTRRSSDDKKPGVKNIVRRKSL